MKVNLAKTSGFCFGVKRALKIATTIARSTRHVEMLGDIVHNETVVGEINKLGIKKIGRLTKGNDKALLIRAHGTSRDTLTKARRLGYKIIDATCPMVKEIHRTAQDMERIGFRIIIIGDKRHDEVLGIIGQLKTKAIVIDSPGNLPLKRIQRIKKACIIVQSTQNLEEVTKIVSILKPYLKEWKFFNTICLPTRVKQQEIKKLPLENDVMIIIGSRTSANTKRLYEISKALNRRTYWVNSRKEIKLDWLKDAESVGITAGASTPDSITQGIVKYIKKAR